MISEFMLQQTTVHTVIPYFHRFIERFPTIDALALAEQDEVYAVWQGLGYYSRARHVHQAAQAIHVRGSFPETPNDLIHLPGMGPYTASAIAAIAFNYPVMPVDGNVCRVASRLWGISAPKGPHLTKQTTENITAFVCHKRKDNTHIAQALMELGALVCKPKNPLCHLCPLQKTCVAFNTHTLNMYPVLLPKKETITREGETFLLINQQNEIYMVKRPNTGLFAHMYVFPTTSFDDVIGIQQNADVYTHPTRIKHVFTHFTLFLTVHVIQNAPYDMYQHERGRWVPLEDLATFAMPRIMHKVLDMWRESKASSFF
jgi:A/G-specific adenine glycosylase